MGGAARRRHPGPAMAPGRHRRHLGTLLTSLRRHPDRLAVTACAVLGTVSNLVWLATMRRGGVVNIDEAAYLGGVFDDTTRLRAGGARGLWEAWTLHADYTPLVPLSAVPVQLVAGLRPLLPLVVLNAWSALLLVATAHVARRVTDRVGAAVAVISVAGMPAVLDQSRVFLFGLPAAALLTTSLALLLASERCTKAWPTVLAGVVAGLALLARSMMVSLVPGLFLVALLLAVRSPRRGRALGLVAAAGAAGLLLAATWYLPNLGAVTTYLVNDGYGAVSTEYGVRQSPLSPGFWGARILLAERAEVHLPLAVVLGAGLSVLAATALVRWRRREFAGGARAEAATACAIVAAEGYVALSSSSNHGAYFELPVLPTVVILAVAGLWQLPRPAVRRTALATAVLVALGTMVIKTDLVAVASAPRTAELPLVGAIVIVDGRGEIQRYAHDHGGAPGDSLSLGAVDHEWPAAAARLDAALVAFAHAHAREPVLFFATRDGLLSSNHLGLAARYALGSTPIPVGQLTPRDGDTVANYRRLLTDPRYGQPNLLITGDPSVYDFRPRVTQAVVADAARAAGFTPAFGFTLPSGRNLQVWWLERGPVQGAPG